MKNKICIWGIYDTFHPMINGDNAPLIRSDNTSWDGDVGMFLYWCNNHNALDKIFMIGFEDIE